MASTLESAWVLSLAVFSKGSRVLTLLFSPVLSCLLLIVPRARGLTFTFARVLVRALVDGPDLQPTDAEDRTLCADRARVPTLAV